MVGRDEPSLVADLLHPSAGRQRGEKLLGPDGG